MYLGWQLGHIAWFDCIRHRGVRICPDLDACDQHRPTPDRQALDAAPVKEELMQRTWQTRRSCSPRDAAQRRWDTAYQQLLQWTGAYEQRMHATLTDTTSKMEDTNGNTDRPKCAGFHQSPTADPHD